MRLLILILLFPFIAHGQIVRTHPYYKPFAASCSYLLDQYSGAAAAYSLRKLDCDYAGSAVRVRESGGNTEADIGFTASGDLDTTALKNFCGSNSGYVVTWYDQSGNGSNVTQSTAGNQPKIVTNGVIEREGARPAVFFAESSSTYLNGGDILDMTELYFNTFSTVKFSSTTAAAYGKSQNSSGYDLWSLLYDGTLYSLFWDGAGATRNANAASNSNYNIYETYINKSTDTNQLRRNASQLAVNTNTISNTYTGNANSFFIGVYQSAGTTPLAGYYLDGRIGEIIVYRKYWTSDERAAITSNINTYYSIY